ncbi:MAG: ABC transporter permease [Eubacteriales bacterium]|nr:ABC transporter permease [Eubacteriales bacterium]
MKKNKIVNASPKYLKYKKGLKTDIITTKLYQILLLVLFLGLWELLVATNVLDAFFFSCPSRICSTLIELFASGNLIYHMWVTLSETFIGFIIATSLGTLIAIALWWSDKLRKVLDPYIVVLNSLPKIALGPLIIIWVGAGTNAIVTMCVLICIVITILTMLSAFLNCDKDKILLMKSFGANKFQILTKLILPNALVDFISVLKINVGMAWVGTIMGEYLVSKAGLGYLIVYGSQIFKLDIVLTSTVVLCILAGGMYALVGLLERKVKKG